MTREQTGNEALSPIKRALLEIRELRGRLADAEAAAHEPVALVGAGLRLPGGVNDMAGLWALLSQGRDAITGIPADRWDVDALVDDDDDAPGKMITRHGGFIEGVDQFDAEFFGIAPREAQSMDPQQRVLLETAWHALEDAAIAPNLLAGSATGVFLGVCNNDYGRMLFAQRDQIDTYVATGNASSVAAGRLSYFFGAQGPNITIDTACSSSLVALHLAVQSLRAGECNLALAGGVNLILSPEMNISFSKGRMMARDGRCKTFDAAADGYVRSEGCGIVVLRLLRDCTPADRVLAVVRGTAINQDGRSNGLTAPNGPAQEAVLRAALAAAGVEGAQVGYVETHGTGTPLGDPIEVQALSAVLCEGRDAPLAIGSIKTNIGHLEAAAGVAGLLKLVLSLQHREIPAHLHLQTLSPHIDRAALRIEVPTVTTPWPAIGGRRLAGVSSFGFSGTNAHAIVEAASDTVAAVATTVDRPQHLLALSARDTHTLRALAGAYAERLQGATDPLADICFTANTGRAHFAHRLALRADSAADLQLALRAAATGGHASGLISGTAGAQPPRVAFLFTGGGAQSAGMARLLDAQAPVFRQMLDAAAVILDPLLGRPIRDLLNAGGDTEAPIHQTRYGQPVLVAVEIALAALWRSWGIEPVAVLGHSLGEYAAAHVAGVISLEDALRIVVERTRQVDSLTEPGAMATIFAPASDVQTALDDLQSLAGIAAYNGPEQVVVSGPQPAVDALCARFEAQGIRVSRLRVAYASHSALMDPVLDAFERAIEGVRYAEPRISFISNLTGAAAGLDVIGRASYWRAHLRHPVRFAQSVESLQALGITQFVEIGPHPVLVGMGAACVPPGVGCWLPSLRRDENDWSVILDSLQTLYVAGAAVDWAGFDQGLARRRVALPLYPFQRKRHWADGAAAAAGSAPDDLHAWRSVATALARQAECSPIGIDLTGYPAKWDSLARLTSAHAVAVLRGASLFARSGERATLAQVMDRLGAAEVYRHLLQRWLQRLVQGGQLRADGDAFVCNAPLAEEQLAACWAEAQALLADNAPLLDYIRHCGALLPAVLRGEQSPLETLFPGGEFDLADGLYRRSATMRYINDLAASAVQAFAAARGVGTIRVLEIGSGTGGTTAALLPCLPAGRTAYRYTDVSPFFFDRAREQFAAWPGIEFAEFDIDQPLPGQGVAAGSFDLVIASNAVHASRDLRAALQRLRALVAPGGLLLLVESTTHLAWFDMTTGLIEGWQQFADDLRTENPLLPAATWLEALREAGFDEADAWPRAGSAADALAQHVVVARVAGQSRAGSVPAAATAAVATNAPAATEDSASLRQRLAEALLADRMEMLRDFVRSRVTGILKLDPAEPPGRNERLMDLGFDSLMAIQLRNQLSLGLGLKKPLPATLMFDYPTIDALAGQLLERVAPQTAPAALKPAAAPEPATLGAEAVAAMSDAEIEALLLSRVERS